MEMDYEDDDYYFDDEYLYVEDSFAAADELAETSVPSPPAYDRIDDDYEGYDYYDYYLDTEFGTDEYYDVRLPTSAGKQERSGQKRKLQHATNSPRPHKQSKKDPKSKGSAASSKSDRMWLGPNVLYRPFQETHTLRSVVADEGKSENYALLPDWRDKFPQARNKGSRDKGELEHVQDSSKMDVDGAEGDWEDEEEEDDGPEDATGLDPEVLMSILQNKLSESGMGGDGGQLQEMIAQMLSSGRGNMEELLEGLTNSVLEQVDKGGADSGMGKWLSQQGVRIQEDEEAEEEAEDDNRDDGSTEEPAPNPAKLKSPKTNGVASKASDSRSVSKLPDPSAVTNGKLPGHVEPAGATSKRQRKQKPTAQTVIQDEEVEAADVKSTAEAPNTARGTKRKAGGDAVEQEPKKQARGGYAAATKSCKTRSEQTEKRPTRSTRQR
ncbi:hypothetical protein BDZ85DRAFT_260107 [Elsinoe ampelina]|uniref:Uncharacterized protein n=1 Tax=Elsinoe ampelina TaxID=302913 RepID=A0A6A6GE77_9PEZI|nr:hypothetical protein BDZ85DRAFT_260107 [Elsinoe ampelina]